MDVNFTNPRDNLVHVVSQCRGDGNACTDDCDQYTVQYTHVLGHFGTVKMYMKNKIPISIKDYAFD